jgi:hypothetical protein
MSIMFFHLRFSLHDQSSQNFVNNSLKFQCKMLSYFQFFFPGFLFDFYLYIRYLAICQILGIEFAFLCATLQLSVQTMLSGAVLHDVFTSILMLIN